MAKPNSSVEEEKRLRKENDKVEDGTGKLVDRKTYLKETFARLMADNEIRHQLAVLAEEKDKKDKKNDA